MNLLNKKYSIYSEAVSMPMSEVITRRQSGHLNKIKMAESDDPWELPVVLLVCVQGKALDVTFFPAGKTKPDKRLTQMTCSSFGRRFRSRR